MGIRIVNRDYTKFVKFSFTPSLDASRAEQDEKLRNSKNQIKNQEFDLKICGLEF